MGPIRLLIRYGSASIRAQMQYPVNAIMLAIGQFTATMIDMVAIWALFARFGALDGWVREHLTTALHLSGSARMGPAADQRAVVDQELRVRGVDGLRVVDTSVLPRAPSRGPAATAVMVGERAAELMT